MKKGAFVGKFLPPHVGHISVIENAASKCDELWVVISDCPQKSKELCEKANFPYFSSLQRKSWFEKHYKNNPKIHFAIIDETKIKNSKNFMKDYAELFYQILPNDINMKFADISYKELNDKFFPKCQFVEIDRDKINIHGTDIRNDYKKNRQYVLREAREEIDKYYNT